MVEAVDVVAAELGAVGEATERGGALEEVHVVPLLGEAERVRVVPRMPPPTTAMRAMRQAACGALDASPVGASLPGVAALGGCGAGERLLDRRLIGERRDRGRLDAADEVGGHQAAVGAYRRAELHLADALALAPVVDGRHLGDRGTRVVELEQQLDVCGEARLADEEVAVGVGGAAQRAGTVDAVERAERVDVAQATGDAERPGDRFARPQAPAFDAHDLAARRVDGGEDDVEALLEQLEHAGQVVEVARAVGLEGDDRLVVAGLLERGAQTGVDRGAEPEVAG